MKFEGAGYKLGVEGPDQTLISEPGVVGDLKMKVFEGGGILRMGEFGPVFLRTVGIGGGDFHLHGIGTLGCDRFFDIPFLHEPQIVILLQFLFLSQGDG